MKYYKLTLDQEDMMMDGWERVGNICTMIDEECSKGNSILIFSVPDVMGSMPNDDLNNKLELFISEYFNNK